ncbi:MAG: DNA mismatch repair endonuclease MutL [Gammaproteobacteria bacterium]|nr:DNA mismatch repair endonuclease MutL [Gammaproteobacteria bacterium]
MAGEGTLTTAATVSVPRIQALAGVLSNQIAAGEVIERPASVVKELIENSLDAAARRIQIEVEAGGVGLIRVRDDGCGIHPDDLRLALGRHATSKIASLNDLERVRSFGFRGEALPSIASVSRLRLASRTADSDSGFEVVAEGAPADAIRPVAIPLGTLVSVRDLFFNTPARRKFLRTERTEFRHLEDVVKRAALSRFDVGFGFQNNGREVLRLTPAVDPDARRARIARLLGQAFAGRALEMAIEGAEMSLKGWVAAPDAARAHTDLQYFFINGRAVRDGTARHAVRQAFGERLAPGRHPAYVLYLDLDPSQLDVNVHPAKHEVRFRQNRMVHDFLWRGLSRALDEALRPPLAPIAAADAAGRTPREAEIIGGPTTLTPAAAGGRIADMNAHYGVTGASDSDASRFANAGVSTGPERLPTVISGRYAVTLRIDGVAITDLAETRRRKILESLRRNLAQADGVSRPLLLPITLAVPEGTADGLQRKLDTLSRAGFDLRRSAPASVSLRAVPACLAHVPAPALMDAILHWGRGSADPAAESLAESLASAGGDRLDDLRNDPQAMDSLVKFANAQPVEGNPRLMLDLDASDIAALMRR